MPGYLDQHGWLAGTSLGSCGQCRLRGWSGYFAAAGNNIRDGFPTRETVWPARFTRAVGVCGATADKSPYFKTAFNGMQDNFGPEHKMDTAIAAYTTNAPWAEMGCSEVVSMNGGGT